MSTAVTLMLLSEQKAEQEGEEEGGELCAGIIMAHGVPGQSTPIS